jgi:hypothetical protein
VRSSRFSFDRPIEVGLPPQAPGKQVCRDCSTILQIRHRRLPQSLVTRPRSHVFVTPPRYEQGTQSDIQRFICFMFIRAP